jgi:hypothetical protein
MCRIIAGAPGNLGAQLIALSLLAFAPPALLVVPYVKNAIKGVGFFLGALLLTLGALLILAALVLVALILAIALIKGDLGTANAKAKFRHMFSHNRAVNMLAAARIFLFGARDVWFVVGLPVFFVSVLGWDFWLAGGFMAAWTIGYGFVQAATPGLIRRRVAGAHEPDGRTATGLAFGLAVFPTAIALALMNGIAPVFAVVGGLLAFGVVFALNSAVHSYLILAYTDSDKVAMNVGFYYMANAMGRLTGTVLSGLLYQVGVQSGPNGGLVACLWASVAECRMQNDRSPSAAVLRSALEPWGRCFRLK